jgi:hypothetical protein
MATAKIVELEKNDPVLLATGAAKILETHRCIAFGIPYDDEKKPPHCITEFADRASHLDPEGDSEDDDDSMVEGFPYSLMRDRQPGDPPMRDLLQMYHRKQPPPRPGLWTRFDHSFFKEKRIQEAHISNLTQPPVPLEDDEEQEWYWRPDEHPNLYLPKLSEPTIQETSRRVSVDPQLLTQPNVAVEDLQLEEIEDKEEQWFWRADEYPNLYQTSGRRVSIHPLIRTSPKAASAQD